MKEMKYPTKCPDCGDRIGQFNARYDFEDQVYKCDDCVEKEEEERLKE